MKVHGSDTTRVNKHAAKGKNGEDMLEKKYKENSTTCVFSVS